MKKLLLVLLAFVFLFAPPVRAALNLMTWDGSASSDFNDTANWTGNCSVGTTLSAGDSCLMNSGAVAATLSANLDIGALITTTGYTGNLSWSGKVLTVEGNCNLAGSGTVNMGNGLTMNGASAALTLAATSGVITATNCALTMNGTTGMTITNGKSATFASLTLGASAIVVINGTVAMVFSSSSAPLIMGNNSSLTSTVVASLSFTRTTSGDMFTMGSGCTLNIGAKGLLFIAGGTNAAITVPALTVSGTTVAAYVQFSEPTLSALTGISFTFTGHQNYGSAICYIYVFKATTTMTINFDTYDLTCGAFKPGGVALTTGTETVNYGSGTINCASYSSALYNNATTYNFQASQWLVAGDFTIGGSNSINPGTTAKITVTNTSNITSAGKSLPELALNATGKAITFIDKFRTIGDLTLTAGKITPFKGRDSVLGNYYNNLTAAADTVNRIDTLYLFGSYTRASGSHAKNDTAQTMICGTALCNWTSSGFTANMVRLIGTNKTKQLKLIDNSIFKFLKDSTGTINTNGKKLTCDSSLFIVDSLFTSAGDTITTPKLLVSSSAKLNINSSLFYFGLALKDTLYDSCTSSLGKIVVNKSGNGLVQSGNSYSRKMELTDGSFDLASIGDSIVTDTLNVTTTDTVTLKYIHLTGTHPTLVLGTGAKIGFLSGAKIIVDVCNTFDLTNDWGGVVPTICYPPTGPFSFAAPPVAVVGSAITPFSAVNSGCGFDSCRISPALSGGLSIGTGANEGEVSGTPTETKAATLYTVVYVNNGVSGKYRDSATFTLTVNPALPAISYSIPAKCTLGVNRSFSMSNTGGPADSVKVVVGSLLSAIICNKTTGTIDGVPATTQAVATDTVQAWNVTGSSKTPFTYTVYGCLIGLSYGAQTADTVAKAISTLSPTFGGCTPDSLNFAAFTITGLSGNHSTGAITGTPTIAGHDSVRVVSYAGVKTDSAVGYAVITSHGGATATAVPASGSSTGATIKIYWRGAFTSTGIGGTISGTALTSLTRITADSATAVIPVLSAGVKIIRVGNNLGDSASANYSEVLPSITGTKRFRFGFGFGF